MAKANKNRPATHLPETSQLAVNLRIEYRPIESIRLDPHNPRIHSDRQVQQIAESVKAFGLIMPILVGDDSTVIAGHGRLLACQFLGLLKVPVIRLSHLSKHQRRAFMIADNRLAENSKWDRRLLAEELQILVAAELDFNLETIGFEMGEIDLLIEDLAPPESEVDPADLLPEPSPIAVTRLGDIWVLDQHRIACADALEEESYLRLMKNESANVVFTDPPYNVRVRGNVSGKGKIQHREFAMASGEMDPPEFIRFLKSSLTQVARFSSDDSLHYLCMDWRHLKELLAAAEDVYPELKNLCVWTKDNAGMGSFYRSQHELVFVFSKRLGPHRNNIQLGRFGRSRTNVWQYPGANSFSRSSLEGNLLALHPTPKPVALVADAIKDCSARGEIVLDPFLGSGTTVVAAARTGRACYGMDLDPLYVDTIIRRCQKFTGLNAVLEETGDTFDQREKEVLDETE